VNTINVTREFDTDDKCFDYLEKMRWPNGVACLECGSLKVSRITREAKSKNKRTRLYQCLEKECGHQFSATAGTIFADTHLPLKTWFMAIALICEAKKSLSACQLQRHLGLGSYRTAWHLAHRIRAAMAENDLVLSGPAVEADETYVGPRNIHRPRHARPVRQKKDVVLGMVERGGGRLKLVPVPGTKASMLQPHLEKHISEHVGTIYSDEHSIYIFALKGKFPGKHQTINHQRTYALGDTHTNTIENAFSLLKKGLYGSFHHVSKKHLARYCDEFSYRFNRRKEQPQLFEETAKSLLRGTPLTYESLIAEAESSEPTGE
jgi:ISXO2-like transposase domain/Transposase zinc-ribbon domain